jgi:hypothetical protein
MTDWKELWPVEPLPEATLKRMVARAVAHPQLLPWPQVVAQTVERALSDWRYGLGYKMMAAAACLLLGLGIGLSERTSTDVTGLAFAHSGVESSLEGLQ